MKGFSANLGFLWPDLPLIERINAAADAGFQAVELHWPYDTPAEKVWARCRLRGVTLLALNTVRGDVEHGDNGLAALPDRREAFRAALVQSIIYCRKTGATAIHCMAGKIDERDRQQARRTLIENITMAARLAEGDGLTILLEPLNVFDAPGYFYSTIDEAADIIAAVGSRNVKIMYDAYHVGRGGKDIIAELERYYDQIGHVQIASIPDRREPSLRNGGHFPAFIEALDRLGYTGWIGAEYKPEGQTNDGLGWREELLPGKP